MSRLAGSARKFAACAVIGLFALATATAQSAARVALPQAVVAVPAGASDAGELPASQTIPSIVIELKRTAAQQADLDSFLAAVGKPGSSDFRKWMTPASFAARFAPTSDVVAQVTTWLSTQGLQVQSTSAGGMRLMVSGTVQQTETAFSVGLHRMATVSGDGVLVTGSLSVPTSLAASIRAVTGIASVPGTTDGVANLAASVDADTAAIVVADLTTMGSVDELTSVLEQASAQGQSVLALHADPAVVPARALSLVVAGNAAATASAQNTTARPDWQNAAGLPNDGLRDGPDAAAATDTSALTAALQSIVAKAGTRQGEVAATFYKLAPEAGVFTHADSTVAAGTWTSTDGLGTVNADALVKAWPFGVTVPQNASLVLSSQVVTHGSNITLTATVAGNGTTTPTGTVTFASSQGGTLATATLNASGVATYTTNALAGGQYGFYGTYNGDNTYATATTNVTTATIQPEAVTVVGSVPSTAISVGGTIPVTVTVTAPSGVGTPTGTVNVYAYGTNVSSQSFTGTLAAGATEGTATASVSVPATNVGSFTFQTNCTTSASFSCYSPTPFAVTVGKGTPVVTLATPTITTGTNPTLTATVAAPTGTSTTAPVPTGSVQFLDGTTVLGTGTLTSTGTATYTGALATGTMHSLTAVYAGDTNYATATSPAVSVNTTANLISTTTSLTSSSGYSGPFGTSFTFLSSVTPASYVTSGASPTGTITITDSVQGVVGTGTLASGSASIMVSTLTVGAHKLTATYSGDSNYAASTSTSNVTITITAVTATVTAAVAPTGSIPYGYNATVNITVTANSGTVAPTGTVTATLSGTGGSYTGTLNAGTGTSSTAGISFPVPPPGSYTITVTCNASITCNTATASVTSTKGYTTTSLAVTPTTPQAGDPITVTATVANSGTGTGTYTYSGTVSFYSGNRFLGSAPVSNGTATRTVVLTNTTTQQLIAVYSGDTNWNGSTSTATSVTPTPLPSAISLTSNVTTGIAGQNITLTATVISGDSASTIIPTGTVAFYDTVGGTVVSLGSSALISNTVNAAIAQLSTTGLIAGTHNITAVYSGDGVYTTVTSSVLVVNIGDFTVSFVPGTLQISSGKTGTATALVSALNGFTGTVALGCTPPANALTTCTITPATVAAGGTAQLTITTTANTSSLLRPARPGSGSGPVIAVAGLVGLVSLCFARRRGRMAGLLVLMLALLLANGGCGTQQVDTTDNSGGSSGGGTGSGGTSNNGTPLGTYSFTVTGASVNAAVNARHNYTLSVTVQ